MVVAVVVLVVVMAVEVPSPCQTFPGSASAASPIV